MLSVEMDAVHPCTLHLIYKFGHLAPQTIYITACESDEPLRCKCTPVQELPVGSSTTGLPEVP